MIKLNVKDTAFAHDICSVAGKKSRAIEWVRDGSGDPRVQFYTHEQCFQPLDKEKINIAWLVESQAIIPHVYANFHTVANNFDVILTHSSKFLKQYPHAMFSAGGGIWIGGRLGGGEIKIYEKGGTAGLVSMVSSEKMMCQLHKFRYDIARFYQSQTPPYGSTPTSKVDVFGLGDWHPIIDSLERYRFSIVIENFVDTTYFTEKILNCFATGTIPIYYGAEDIGLYFNTHGIIRFSSKEELDFIINKLTIEDYKRRIPAILDNFHRCKDYEIIEDRFIRILDMRGDI